MSNSITSNKIPGLLLMVLGIVAFLPFFSSDVKSKLIIPSDVFFVKYVLFITFINGGLGSIVLGILNYLGILTSYYSPNIDIYQKAKIHLIVIIISIPILISWSFVVFIWPATNWFKVVWVLLLILTLNTLFSSIKTLKKGRGSQSKSKKLNNVAS